MTQIDWAQLETDRAAGALDFEFVESVSPDGQEWLGCGVAVRGQDEFLWLENNPDCDIPLCYRIARVPDLEAHALRARRVEAAADELAQAVRMQSGISPRVSAALAAYQAAKGGDA